MTPPAYVDGDAPPSLYAVAAVLEGQNGGWPRVAGNTAIRAAALAPGIYLGFRVAGVRRPRLRAVVAASLVGSMVLTGLIFVLYGAKKATLPASTG